MRILACLFFVGAFELAHAGESLKELVAQIEATASEGEGMDQAEQKLAKDISAHKTDAADLLVPLLKSGNKAVRDLAGYCLLELPKGSLLKKHLPALMEACTKERGWLPNAIADIDDEQAVSFLAKDFRRSPETQGQIDNALVRTSPRSIAPLLGEFRLAEETETEFLDKLAEVWTDLGEAAKPAVPFLLEIAVSPKAPVHRRLAAIRYLGAIGPTAESSFPKLKELAVSEPVPYADAVEKAIVGSRTGEAATKLLLQAIAAARHDGELYLFRDLADLGKNAAAVGDQLADLLDDPDPGVRLGACRTLGYTTRLDLWPFLAKALKDSDWRVAFAACSSISQLKAKGADASLEALAKSHWYPRVRHAALCARYRIKGEVSPEEHSRHVSISGDDNDFFFDFSESDILLAPMAEAKLGLPELDKRERFPWGTEAEKDAGEVSFMTLHPELHRAISASPDAKKWGNICRFVDMVEKEETHFVALSAGEWVGGLFSLSGEGKAVTLLKENIAALIEWDNRLVTLSGMYHMGMDEGAVHEVVFKDGEWRARYLYALPGCPISGGLLPDGRLVANCEGGAVAIGKDGRFEYLGSGEAKSGE